MGMYLDPVNKDIEGFGLNWTGWRVLSDLLEDLNCNTNEMAQTNDGYLLPQNACTNMAVYIRAGLHKGIIKTKTVMDSDYEGGKYHAFEVLTQPDTSKKLRKQDKEWLIKLVSFLENCNGAKQF